MQSLVKIGRTVGPCKLPPLNMNTKAWGSMQYILKANLKTTQWIDVGGALLGSPGANVAKQGTDLPHQVRATFVTKWVLTRSIETNCMHRRRKIGKIGGAKRVPRGRQHATTPWNIPSYSLIRTSLNCWGGAKTYSGPSNQNIGGGPPASYAYGMQWVTVVWLNLYILRVVITDQRVIIEKALFWCPATYLNSPYRVMWYFRHDKISWTRKQRHERMACYGFDQWIFCMNVYHYWIDKET